MARRQFGKVLTPLKVHSARLPVSFGLWYAKIGKLDKQLQLPPELVMLIREQVAHINVCEFCMDIGRYFVMKASMNKTKFDALDQYSTSPLFTDAEREFYLSKDLAVPPKRCKACRQARKATRGEGMGFVGAEEGAAALAVATVSR